MLPTFSMSKRSFVNEVEFCVCGNETGSRFYDNDKKTIECVDCGKQIQNNTFDDEKADINTLPEMNNLDRQYQALLQDILDNGVKKKDRTGTGTLSVFGRTIRHKMSEGFPLLTTKKLHWKSIVTELLWFLRGETNIFSLVQNDCYIWVGDAYKNYLKTYPDWYSEQHIIAHQKITQEEFIEKIKNDAEFAKKWGDLGPIYGKQWRSWNTMKGMQVEGNGYTESMVLGWKLRKDEHDNITDGRIQIDQIAEAISKLKKDPDDRGIIVSAWNVGELDQMTLRPCHNFFQFYTRELSDRERQTILLNNNDLFSSLSEAETQSCALSTDLEFVGEDANKILDGLKIPRRAISLMWNQRSVDTFLGLPFNIASYGLLLEIIAKCVKMVPDELIGTLGDTHLYLNHIEQAKTQIGRPLSHQERIDWWFKNSKPNRDVVDHFDTMPPEAQFYSLNASRIPVTDREPYLLPTLQFMKSDAFFKSLGETFSIIGHLDNEDFQLLGYQSHPAIKAPLSN